MELSGEEVADGRETTDRIGCTDHPLAIVVAPLDLLCADLWEVDHPNFRIFCSQFFDIGVIRIIDRPLHV